MTGLGAHSQLLKLGGAIESCANFAPILLRCCYTRPGMLCDLCSSICYCICKVVILTDAAMVLHMACAIPSFRRPTQILIMYLPLQVGSHIIKELCAPNGEISEDQGPGPKQASSSKACPGPPTKTTARGSGIIKLCYFQQPGASGSWTKLAAPSPSPGRWMASTAAPAEGSRPSSADYS